MPQFPGFPSNDFDFHFEEAGGALAGLLMRSRSGDVIPGVLPNVETLLSAGDGWTIRVSPFVAARSKGRSVLLGGTTEDVILDVDPAPSANARIDVVYSLPADVGAGDPPRGVAVAKGTPGPAPAKPVIPSGAIELGTFRTTAGQTGAASGTLTETFKYAALSGGMIYARNRADLNGLDVLDGTRAFVLSDKSVPERVKGKWLFGGSANYIAPFKAFGAGTPDVTISVIGGFVYVSGIATTTQPASLNTAARGVIANVGSDYAPQENVSEIKQGSGNSRWHFEVLPNGDICASRYAPETAGANVWLPFSASWPLKRR